MSKKKKTLTLVVCFLLPLKRERKHLTLAAYFLHLETPSLPACYPLKMSVCFFQPWVLTYTHSKPGVPVFGRIKEEVCAYIWGVRLLGEQISVKRSLWEQEKIGRNEQQSKSKRATVGMKIRPSTLYCDTQQEWPLKPAELESTLITPVKSIYPKWNKIYAENCLICLSGKSWIRWLANIIHISKKQWANKRHREESLKEIWDAEFGTASPSPIDWIHAD